ncbi:hypothetical protein F4813DRAFT_358261, partial [Daldinia decipiens]|uniref:uncharacterized protein n=1 Tax=Daldinia decipiens TaxID=326647 RepID=UPI0020C42809
MSRIWPQSWLTCLARVPPQLLSVVCCAALYVAHPPVPIIKNQLVRSEVRVRRMYEDSTSNTKFPQLGLTSIKQHGFTL